MSIFSPRQAYKPFEYPEITQFTDSINKSFWVHSEIDFTADVQDFQSHLLHHEQQIIKKCLLAIAQIEVNVKTFWGNLYQHLPKPEFNGLGSTFAECEFRHSEAYSRLLEVLNYTDEFEKLEEVSAISDRIAYLKKALKNAQSEQHEEYLFSLILFSILVENVSLFSQFGIILYFTRFKGYLKNTSNIIAWTSIDEQIHANAGIHIINIIQREFPEFLDDKAQLKIEEIVRESMAVEQRILDWIFEDGDLEMITKKDIMNFMKFRVDDSLTKIGLNKLYHITSEQYAPMKWFEEEVFSNSLDDFFAKRPVDYTKHDKSITALDLF